MSKGSIRTREEKGLPPLVPHRNPVGQPIGMAAIAKVFLEEVALRHRFLVKYKSSVIPKGSGEFERIFVTIKGEERLDFGLAVVHLETTLNKEEGGELVLTPAVYRAIKKRVPGLNLPPGISITVLP